jgi:hypothetical protein
VQTSHSTGYSQKSEVENLKFKSGIQKWKVRKPEVKMLVDISKFRSANFTFNHVTSEVKIQVEHFKFRSAQFIQKSEVRS